MSAERFTYTIEPGYSIERIVAGSGFHTANGIAFGPDGRLWVASVSGESIFALDVADRRDHGGGRAVLGGMR